MSKPFQTIVFDFDGTIADTLEAARVVVNGMAEEFGFKQITAEEIPALRKMSINHLLKHLGISKLKVPSLLAKGRKRLKSKIESIPMIEGMAAVIQQLQQRADSLGILSSNSEENVRLFLQFHGISDKIDFIVTTSKLTSKAKYLARIREKFAPKPGGMIYIGDEERDVEACRKVGIPVIAVTWGFNCREMLESCKPDYIAEQADDICQILQQLEESEK